MMYTYIYIYSIYIWDRDSRICKLIGTENVGNTETMHLLLLDFRVGSCRQGATCRNPLAARLIIKRTIKRVWKAPFKRYFKLSYSWAQIHTTTFQAHLNQR